MSDYTWYIEHDLSQFEGQWVAISQEKVVGAHRDLKFLIKKVSETNPIPLVTFAKIPDTDKALVYICFSSDSAKKR